MVLNRGAFILKLLVTIFAKANFFFGLVDQPRTIFSPYFLEISRDHK